MTWRNWRDTLVLIVAAMGVAPLSAATAWADACFDSSDDPVAKCQIQTPPPVIFGASKTHYHTFSCTGANGKFLGNDDGYPGSSGYDFSNPCFTIITTAQTFDGDFNTLITNWCAETETLFLTLGCMPGN